ncbi:hypothetical protein FEM48_Zijuj06G0145900 [Ziziphus jujuba var. spinosa]|uniref:Uncharacterized protein n=1 Tax=Ziziphus jujuba var. spinosa TaxID=714518 RepID=A0A978V9V0_ZIZJJ|nr:hypothetical protein FEM48_Zijuj06G0145900 [Ziziphus jujuba var. spinosa]
MNRLVNIAKDVDLLVKHGIVENMQRDSAEAATLINKLRDEVIVQTNNFYFGGTFEDLNVYYETPWHKWKANLKQNYFNTPWAIVAFIVATLLIILAIIQTVCSILQIRGNPYVTSAHYRLSVTGVMISNRDNSFSG